MARFVWQQIPTTLGQRETTRQLNRRMGAVQAFLQGFVRLGAGYRVSGYLELPQIEADPDPPTTGVRLYVVDSGGKNQLRALFPTGAAQTISTEP